MFPLHSKRDSLRRSGVPQLHEWMFWHSHSVVVAARKLVAGILLATASAYGGPVDVVNWF